MEEKVEHAKELIAETVKKFGLSKIAVACSFGKDSMVVAHIAREVDPNISVFSVMTVYKPRETFDYLVKMNERMNLNVTVYFVTDSVPPSLDGVNVIRLSDEKFRDECLRVREGSGKEIYEVEPDRCCELLKVEPTKAAVKSLDAWISGLRNTEGITRVAFQHVEDKGGLIKVNPILTFTELDVWKYIATRGIEPHPWYRLGYRSLGCVPCSNPGGESERDGRWKGTGKHGGECGIHTKRLK